ncbi:MAG: hypothetical protein AUG10_00545 [Gemmatimonadetes bacterium 13_1_20CM_2_70_10]|nr:MAG: hypothetical protein AUG10_00545 [Gemmatimonadetes bacterium 13_1_20CM_2_70_10]
MALPFHRRIFVILVTMTAVPTTLAVAGWVLSVRTLAPSAGARASFEDVVTSARALVQGVDTMQLTPAGRAALRNHLERVSNSASLARRGETYLRYYTAGFAIVIVTLGALVLFAAVRLAGHLSRQLSRPIDELRGAPEFESLRQALRDLATALDVARDKELEAERLRAFREVARRVAHEIKNPLTSMRIAVDQLSRTVGPSDGRTDMAMEVMTAETDRLERLAREFADFGRMPEGAQSEVDLLELLEELGRTGVPDGVRVRVEANGGRRSVMGHYEPLRRAFANLLRNAAEAMHGAGAIDVGLAGDAAGLVVTIADHGPGIGAALRPRVFEPYFTTKADGTGLGLALVRQTMDAHRATITVDETPGGGATFTIVFAT